MLVYVKFVKYAGGYNDLSFCKRKRTLLNIGIAHNSFMFVSIIVYFSQELYIPIIICSLNSVLSLNFRVVHTMILLFYYPKKKLFIILTSLFAFGVQFAK